jgi:hypothetical protein
MEMEQMMAYLLANIKAEIRTSQAKTDATLKELKAGQEHLKDEILTKMEINQEKMMAKLDASHQRLMARIDSKLETVKTCLGKNEVTDFQANQEEI